MAASEKAQTEALLLMLRGALLDLEQADREKILNTAQDIKKLAAEECGELAVFPVAIANLEMSLEQAG